MLLKKLHISKLKPDTYAESDFYSEKNELLIGKGTHINDTHIRLLLRRNVFELYKKVSKTEEVQKILKTEFSELNSVESDISLEEIYEDSVTNKRIIDTLDQKLHSKVIGDTPKGIPYKTFATQIKVGERTNVYFNEISHYYSETLKTVRSVIMALLAGEKHCESQIKSIVDRIAKIFLSDKNILLNISSIKPEGIEHLYYHSLNVCILSINIAASYGYPKEQIIEIGIGALLHDIGMFLIPKEIRYKTDRFSQEEWFEIKKHPIVGLHLLEQIHELPESALYIAYQTHERQDSSGYPKQRGVHLIHHYAKIVQVADIYEALSSPRPHREATIPFKSVENLIKMSKINLISKDVVKAFITYMSTYPIGSLVMLSNRCIAKVIDVNQSILRRPVVSVLTNSIGTPLAKTNIFQIDLNRKKDISIVKPIPHSMFNGIGIMDGF